MASESHRKYAYFKASASIMRGEVNIPKLNPARPKAPDMMARRI